MWKLDAKSCKYNSSAKYGLYSFMYARSCNIFLWEKNSLKNVVSFHYFICLGSLMTGNPFFQLFWLDGMGIDEL